jgi:hypothetical protein
VVSVTNRSRRLVAGAFAAAAVAVPFYAAISTDAAPELTAGPPCLAWFGSIEDGKCLSYSNGGNSPNSGFYTGPLLPGTTIRQGTGIGAP